MTANTEHVLGAEHVPQCLVLSQAANWNQNEADWRLMLGFGRGWGIALEDGTLAASTVVLPYGPRFAWVAMVLVLPEHRRKGFATQLLKKALAENSGAGRASLLDATPAGFEVYSHRNVPPNDGGLALGQAAVAARRMSGKDCD